MNATVAVPRNTRAATLLGRVMWTGIIVNVLLAVPCLIDPAGSIAFMGMPDATPLMWPRFSAELLIMLSLFQIPGAMDPYRYRANAWLAVVSRFVGVVFFGSLTLVSSEREYWLFAVYDFTILLPKFLLVRKLDSHGNIRGR